MKGEGGRDGEGVETRGSEMGEKERGKEYEKKMKKMSKNEGEVVKQLT